MTKDRDFVVERCQQLLGRARSKSPYLSGSAAERLIDELADEIERLTKEAWETFEANGDLAKLITEKYVENDRLRAENEGLREEVAILRTTEAAEIERLRALVKKYEDEQCAACRAYRESEARRALEQKP